MNVTITTNIAIRVNGNVVASGSLTDECIHEVEVAEKYRRQGYGTMLVKKLISLGGRWMWVNSNNQAAMALYTHLGFEITGVDGGFARMQLPRASEVKT